MAIILYDLSKKYQEDFADAEKSARPNLLLAQNLERFRGFKRGKYYTFMCAKGL